MKCPKCRKEIPFEATRHQECGWNVERNGAVDEGKALICERCGLHPARIRRPVEGKDLNVCVPCDVELVQASCVDVTDQLPPPAERTHTRAASMAIYHRPDPIEHWNKVLATPRLPEISYRTATVALERLGRFREPGQDDEEVRTRPAPRA